MFLFEIENRDIIIKLVVACNQLQDDLDNGEIPVDFSVDDLLNYLQEFDIIVDVQDLYNMITVPPMGSVISNIQGDDIVFVGEESEEELNAEDEDEKTVASMADRAMNRPN